MMPKQLPLGLKSHPRYERENFVVSEQNRAVWDLLLQETWPHLIGVLSGHAGVGKTHLGHIWAQQNGAQVVAPNAIYANAAQVQGPLVIDQMEDAGLTPKAQEALFHRHNVALRENTPLLFIGRGTVEGWPITLPDLKSRLQGAVHFTLAPPDDQSLTHILTKLFLDRGLDPAPKALAYLVARVPRSVHEVQAIVAHLDTAALAQRRAITVPFVAQELKTWLTEAEK